MNKNKYLYLIFLFFIQVLFSFCDNKNVNQDLNIKENNHEKINPDRHTNRPAKEKNNELYYEDLPNGELDTTFISKSNNNKSPKKIDTIKVLKVK
jgi:hypothetical protein